MKTAEIPSIPVALQRRIRLVAHQQTAKYKPVRYRMDDVGTLHRFFYHKDVVLQQIARIEQYQFARNSGYKNYWEPYKKESYRIK